MEITVYTIVIYLLIPVGAYFVKSLLDRLNKVEEKQKEAVSEPEMRRIMDDKINPIKEDITEIKYQLNKLLDIFLK